MSGTELVPGPSEGPSTGDAKLERQAERIYKKAKAWKDSLNIPDYHGPKGDKDAYMSQKQPNGKFNVVSSLAEAGIVDVVYRVPSPLCLPKASLCDYVDSGIEVYLHCPQMYFHLGMRVCCPNCKSQTAVEGKGWSTNLHKQVGLGYVTYLYETKHKCTVCTGRGGEGAYTFGMLDVPLPLCLTAHLPGFYTTRESGLTDLAREVCARGQINGQSTADQADMLRELGELQHARKGLQYYGHLDLMKSRLEDKAKVTGQQTLAGFVTRPGPAAPPQPWPAYAEVRAYDASAGFIARSMDLAGKANVDLATKATVQVTGEIISIDHQYKPNKTCGPWAKDDFPTPATFTVMTEVGLCAGIYGVPDVSSEATAEVLQHIKQRYISKGDLKGPTAMYTDCVSKDVNMLLSIFQTLGQGLEPGDTGVKYDLFHCLYLYHKSFTEGHPDIGSCLWALSEAVLPRILEEGRGYQGRRATGSTAELLPRFQAAFERFEGAVDPVTGQRLYTDATYALHERQWENAQNHQLTDPAGVDMYTRLPDGKLLSKRGSSKNESLHSITNRIFHGSNVGMQLFHNKLVNIADRHNMTKRAQLAGQRQPYMFDRALGGSVNRHAQRLGLPLPYKGMEPLRAELVLGERKSRGTSLTLDAADRQQGMQQIGLAYRPLFNKKTASIDVEREADQAVSQPVQQGDELAVFEDTAHIAALLSEMDIRPRASDIMPPAQKGSNKRRSPGKRKAEEISGSPRKLPRFTAAHARLLRENMSASDLLSTQLGSSADTQQPRRSAATEHGHHAGMVTSQAAAAMMSDPGPVEAPAEQLLDESAPEALTGEPAVELVTNPRATGLLSGFANAAAAGLKRLSPLKAVLGMPSIPEGHTEGHGSVADAGNTEECNPHGVPASQAAPSASGNPTFLPAARQSALSMLPSSKLPSGSLRNKPAWLRKQPSARTMTILDVCRPIRTVEEQRLFHELYPLYCNERGVFNATAMTADWNVQVGMSCASDRPQQIFMKSANHLLLFAKQLVTELNARDSRIIREAVCVGTGNFRLEHYEQVPVMRPNAAAQPAALGAAAAQLATTGATENKKVGRGAPNAPRNCGMCDAALNQGGQGGKRRNVGRHNCKFCRFCFEELGLKKGDAIPEKATCKHCHECSVRGKVGKVVLKKDCPCKQAASFFTPKV